MKKQWEQERKQLLGEQAVLQDAAKRLNVQVQTAQQDAKTKNGNQGASLHPHNDSVDANVYAGIGPGETDDS